MVLTLEGTTEVYYTSGLILSRLGRWCGDAQCRTEEPKTGKSAEGAALAYGVLPQERRMLHVQAIHEDATPISEASLESASPYEETLRA